MRRETEEMRAYSQNHYSILLELEAELGAEISSRVQFETTIRGEISSIREQRAELYSNLLETFEALEDERSSIKRAEEKMRETRGELEEMEEEQKIGETLELARQDLGLSPLSDQDLAEEIDHVQYYSARVEIHAELPKRECPTCGYETNDPNFDFTHVEGR